jgi:hypothetical protein
LNSISERQEGKKYSSLLTDRELEEIQNPLPGSELEKSIQVINDNGVNLTDLINYERSKREVRADKLGNSKKEY